MIMDSDFRPRRGMLYVPGDDLHKIEKAITLGVDSICLDIEDGVALNRKQAARATIANALHKLDFGKAERLVRINPVGSGLEVEDLQSILPRHPDGFVIPKVRDGSQLQWVSEKVTEFEQMRGWESGGIILLALIESAQGVVNLGNIANSSSRLRGLIFGAEDLAGDIGAVRTRPGWEVFYARSATVTYAAAFGLQAMDQVFLDFHDEAGLREECKVGVEMGYSGKQLIHPSQVGPAQDMFAPTDEAIAQALRVLEAASQNQDAGKGAFALDGKMVDAPVVKIAQWVIARARAAGKI